VALADYAAVMQPDTGTARNAEKARLLSVIYGGKDTFIDAQWTTDAIARQCALGGVVQWDLQPDKGHGDVDITRQFVWLADRYAGKPAINQCP
jgi:hypothetical protein